MKHMLKQKTKIFQGIKDSRSAEVIRSFQPKALRLAVREL